MNWHEHLRYEDGNLFWKFRRIGCSFFKPVGSKNSDGYIRIFLFRKRYAAHRVIWEMHNGKIPEGLFIDHIDRNKSNNKIENLRLATDQENKRNNSARGFSWSKSEKKWQSSIGIDNKQIFLGFFETIIDARAAYLRARREHFGEFA